MGQHLQAPFCSGCELECSVDRLLWERTCGSEKAEGQGSSRSSGQGSVGREGSQQHSQQQCVLSHSAQHMAHRAGTEPLAGLCLAHSNNSAVWQPQGAGTAEPTASPCRGQPCPALLCSVGSGQRKQTRGGKKEVLSAPLYKKRY